MEPSPGQHVLGSFPRFGIDAEPPPPPREPASIRVEGALAQPIEFPVARLAGLERREIVADFHCVAGWTTQNLRWAGVPFRTFYETVVVPEGRPEPGVSHVLFQGSDGYHSILTLEDALENDDVLLADWLGAEPLNAKHGAPVRLLSPKQYGHKSTKHLCRVKLLTREQSDGHERTLASLLLKLLAPHPRARVALEERHRYLPAWALRKIYWKFVRWRVRSARQEGTRGGH
jgi:DMSO/TMAO reductase YedYZ molybdopterin-dependent catalytic subunit